MKWHYTDGWNLDDFSTSVTISDDAELSAGQKTPFVQVASSAASKTLLLGLGEGDCMILMNSGNNAITVKNVEGDTGSSVAKGDIVLIVASETADATSVEVLNGSGGGGGGVLVCTFDESNTLDHTWKEISEAPTAIAKSPITPGIYYLTGVIGVGENYAVVFSTVSQGNVIDMLFSTDSENGYPVRQQL